MTASPEQYGVTGGGPVMAIFAHPDDPEFVAGGALARWSEAGRQLIYVICTDGSKGSSDPTMTPDRLIPLRQQEQIAAAKHLGCEEVVFLP
jgi:LmbE family N-acetylglucosaminyl deacetylase